MHSQLRRSLLAAAALAILPAAPAAGQAAPAGNEAITVTGQRTTPAEQRREALAYVKATGVASGHRPAARWIDSICPRVYGLPPPHAARVESRVRALAGELGVPLAAPRCRANAAITFAADAGGFARTIARRSPRHLAEVRAEQRPALFEGAAPIRWWYATDTRGKAAWAEPAFRSSMAVPPPGAPRSFPSRAASPRCNITSRAW